jgi:hypothetical protein
MRRSGNYAQAKAPQQGASPSEPAGPHDTKAGLQGAIQKRKVDVEKIND